MNQNLKNRFLVIYTSMLPLSGPLLSCSDTSLDEQSADTRTVSPDESVVPDTEQSPDPISSSTLTLQSVQQTFTDQSDFGLDRQLILYLDGDASLAIQNSIGQSVSFLNQTESWGEMQTLSDRDPADDANFNLNSDGWIKFSENTLSYLALEDQALEAFTLPFLYDESVEVVGLSVGSLLVRAANDLYIFHYQGTDAQLIHLKSLESGTSVKGLGSCMSGCDIWFWEDAKFYTYSYDDSVLKSVQSTLAAGQFENSKSMTGIAQLEGTLLDFTSFYTLDEDLRLRYLDQSASPDNGPQWQEVSSIIREHCIPCHSSRGFDQESVLMESKADIIRRVSIANKDNNFTMPTAGSSYAQSLTDGERNIVIDWLSK